MEYALPVCTPEEIKSILTATISHIHSLLKDNLVGMYLHGSLATCSFQLGSSDIDLILVVKENLSSEVKGKIISYMNKTRVRYVNITGEQGKSIEMSVFLENVVQNPQYPIVVELRYDYPDNIFENEPDEEAVAFLYEAKERGFCVWGKPIRKVFQKIPAKYYLLSIINDLKSTRKFLLKDPTYWVLNACRIMAFVREGKVLSKLEGGQWGIENLLSKYRNLVNQALSRYQKKVNRDHASWNREELEDFAEYIIEEITEN